ncbi:MAG: radical SAM protein [Colwellia sp.]|nr:radical SAM protein [Colwellia sp.]
MYKLKRDILLIDTGVSNYKKALVDLTNEANIILLDASATNVLNEIALDENYSPEESKEIKALEKLVNEGVFEGNITQKVIEVESLSFWVQMTDKCNLACDYCYIPSLNSRKKIIDNLFDVLFRKLIELKEIKSVNIKLGGGEPLLCFNEWNEKLLTFKKNLDKHNITLNVRIISNLTKVDTRIVNYLLENNIQLSVSLDGVKEYHDKNRIFINGNGSYDTVINNIGYVRDKGLLPSIMTTVTSENTKGVSPIVKEAIKNDTTFRVSDVKGESLSNQQLDSVFEEVYELLDEGLDKGYPVSKRVVFSDLNTHIPKPQPCSMGVNGAAIYLDGSIYFCHTQFDKGTPVGTLFEEENLLNIIKRGFEYHNNQHEDCLKCSFKLVCASGCPLYRVDGKSSMCSSYQKIIPKIYKLYAKEMILNGN